MKTGDTDELIHRINAEGLPEHGLGNRRQAMVAVVLFDCNWQLRSYFSAH